MQQLTIEHFISRFQLQLPLSAPVEHSARQAAVLIPIVCRSTPTLLLTQRADHLRQHPGQIAFPGGVCDLGDADFTATALREAEEEIALPSSQVKILGQLPPLNSANGIQVTPVLGLLPPTITLFPSQHEVSRIFEMPLQQAMTLSRYHSLDIQRNHRSHRLYFVRYQQNMIWGLTALIIYRLAKQISWPCS